MLYNVSLGSKCCEAVSNTATGQKKERCLKLPSLNECNQSLYIFKESIGIIRLFIWSVISLRSTTVMAEQQYVPCHKLCLRLKPLNIMLFIWPRHQPEEGSLGDGSLQCQLCWESKVTPAGAWQGDRWCFFKL